MGSAFHAAYVCCVTNVYSCNTFCLRCVIDACTHVLFGMSEQVFGLHYESGHPQAMAQALKKLCDNVEKAVKNGLEIVILSDRIRREYIDVDRPPIPTLLAVGAVHHHLIR